MASNLLPSVMNRLIKTNNPNDNSFDLGNMMRTFTGNSSFDVSGMLNQLSGGSGGGVGGNFLEARQEKTYAPPKSLKLCLGFRDFLFHCARSN
ncbi:MAG: hypothetical protein QM734_17485 [Cyclobacteriaceae bacterium]